MLRQWKQKRRLFDWGGRRFRIPPRMQDAVMTFGTVFLDGCVYLLGPFLICFALAIMSGLTWSFFMVVLPMIERAHTLNKWIPALHVAYVLFILGNVAFNYALCVMTSNKGPVYEKVVRELADATGIIYPETPEEVALFKREFEERMYFRIQRRQARAAAAAATTQQTPKLNNGGSSNGMVYRRSNNSNNTSSELVPLNHAATPSSPHEGTTTSLSSGSAKQPTANLPSSPPQPPPPPPPESPMPLRRWMIMGPQEWGFCVHSNQPKPPRSHYDHVTKTLVLTMDHYCPWMFNTVGYFNYRYFCNFLFFVFCGMVYGAIVTLRPFCAIQSKDYWNQVRHHKQHQEDGDIFLPLPKERTAIAFSFMICLSVGLAVVSLLGFHIYLLFTAQTTVEFHGNCANRRRAKKRKPPQKWRNPYNLGWKRNFQQVYGHTMHPIRAVLQPSWREPEFLPLPLRGEEGKRPHTKTPTTASNNLNIV